MTGGGGGTLLFRLLGAHKHFFALPLTTQEELTTGEAHFEKTRFALNAAAKLAKDGELIII